MVRSIMRDPLFLAQKSEPATEADKQVVQDLLDTLKANIETTPDTYYLINYDTWEVVITKGYKGAYKFSDIMNLK